MVGRSDPQLAAMKVGSMVAHSASRWVAWMDLKRESPTVLSRGYCWAELLADRKAAQKELQLVVQLDQHLVVQMAAH